MSAYYLIDYENVHDSGLNGINELNFEDCVFIFYTVHANKISLDALEGIRAGLRVIRVPEGSQSLDRHLISYLGFLLGQESDPETRFRVISRDNGYKKIIEFWNRWFLSDDKVKQRASIGGEAIIADPVPYFLPDGTALSDRGIRLRHAVIRHIKNEGEISENGYRYMLVSTLCAFLNTLDEYCEEREASGKKPMAFLVENLKDILLVRREGNADIAYLIADQYYRKLPQSESPAAPSDLTGEGTAAEPESDESPETAAAQERIEPPEPLISSDGMRLADEKRAYPIEAIVRATFDADAETNDAGRKRVKASILRDRLEKLDGYRLARSQSGKKPLAYLAEALDGLILIRNEKGRCWAYMTEDEAPVPEISEEIPAIPGEDLFQMDAGGTSVLSASSPSTDGINQVKKAIYQKMISNGEDASVALSIASEAASAMLSEQPKAEFHSRLWQLFGQKLGTRYYREAASLINGSKAFSNASATDPLFLNNRKQGSNGQSV